MAARKREPDAAQPERRIFLGREREPGRGLVGTDIERAHDQRAWPQCIGDGLIRRALFGLVGRLRAIEKQEFGAQQPAAFGADWASLARRTMLCWSIRFCASRRDRKSTRLNSSH